MPPINGAEIDYSLIPREIMVCGNGIGSRLRIYNVLVSQGKAQKARDELKKIDALADEKLSKIVPHIEKGTTQIKILLEQREDNSGTPACRLSSTNDTKIISK